jgi:hypothetical protein
VGSLAAEDGVGVLFDGEDGDGLFGAPPYLIADAVRKGRVPTALRLARQLAGMGERPPGRVVRWLVREYGLKGAAPRVAHGATRRIRRASHYAPPWFNEDTARNLLAVDESWEWKRVSGPRWWAHRVDQLTAWRERLGAHDYLRRKAALSGVPDGHPFLDDLDLVEFVLRLPPALAYDASLTRPLLRESMNGLLPDEVRLRPDKSTFNEFIEAVLDGPDRAPLERLLEDAELRAYVDVGMVRDVFFSAPRDRRPLGWAGIVWRLATAECWLRTQADGAFPERVLETWGLAQPRYEIRETKPRLERTGPR